MAKDKSRGKDKGKAKAKKKAQAKAKPQATPVRTQYPPRFTKAPEPVKAASDTFGGTPAGTSEAPSHQ
jgi:hypothetical protein